MTNLLEPWVLLRLVAGLVALGLFARGALTGQKVLRHFDLTRATEGQLALERQLELSATFVRVGTFVQVLALLLTILSADRISRVVRGAMCAYGVFSSQEWGFRALATTGLAALAAGILAQVIAFDGRVRTLDLARPIALATCGMAFLSLADLVMTTKFLLSLDLSVVASCCSIQLDSVSVAEDAHASGPRVLVTAVALGLACAAILSALFASRAPSRGRVLVAGLLSACAVAPALAAIALEVAPHAFEVPTHVCPFCLFKADVLALGYPLFASLFLATTWAGGAAISALLARGGTLTALAEFGRPCFRRVALAWGSALVLAAIPVIRFALVAGGASLFEGR